MSLPKLVIDARLTRRKTYHVLYNNEGEEVFRALMVSQCINSAISLGWYEIAIDYIHPPELPPFEAVLTLGSK